MNIKKSVKSKDNKILFKTNTIIDKYEFKKFQKFYTRIFKKDFKSNLFFKIGMIILAVLAIVLNIIKGNYMMVILLIIFCILYPIILYIGLNRQINKMYTTYKRFNATEEELCFYNNYFKSVSRFNLWEIKYDEVDNIYETKENFYIFYGGNKAFIIIKNNISDLDGFNRFIQEKEKYRRYK